MWLDETIINLKNIVDEIKADEAKYQALSGVVIFFSKVGQIRRSDKNIEEAVKLAEMIKTIDEKSVAYKSIAVCVAKMKESLGQYDQMDSSFDMTLRIKANFERSMALSEIGKVLSRMGDFDTAKKAINQASNLVPNINNALKRSQALTEIVVTTSELGAQTRKTDLIFISVNLSRDIMGGFSRIRANIKIAEAFAMLDDSRRALDFINKAFSNLKNITEVYNRVKALVNLATGLAKVRDYVRVPPLYGTPSDLLDQAEAMAGTVTDRYFRVVAYRAITDGNIELKSFDKARVTMGLAVSTATEITDSYNRSLAFAHLATPFVMLGELLSAKRSIEHSIYHLKQLKNDNFKASAVKNVAESLAEFIGSYDTVGMYLDKVDAMVRDGRAQGADVVAADIMLRKARYALKDNMYEWAINLAIEANDTVDAAMGTTTDVTVHGGREVEVESEEPLPTGLMDPVHAPLERTVTSSGQRTMDQPRGMAATGQGDTDGYMARPPASVIGLSTDEAAKKIAAGDARAWSSTGTMLPEEAGLGASERPVKTLKVKEDLTGTVAQSMANINQPGKQTGLRPVLIKRGAVPQTQVQDQTSTAPTEAPEAAPSGLRPVPVVKVRPTEDTSSTSRPASKSQRRAPRFDPVKASKEGDVVGDEKVEDRPKVKGDKAGEGPSGPSEDEEGIGNPLILEPDQTEPRPEPKPDQSKDPSIPPIMDIRSEGTDPRDDDGGAENLLKKLRDMRFKG